MLYEMSWDNGPRYNDTRLYVVIFAADIRDRTPATIVLIV